MENFYISIHPLSLLGLSNSATSYRMCNSFFDRLAVHGKQGKNVTFGPCDGTLLLTKLGNLAVRLFRLELCIENSGHSQHTFDRPLTPTELKIGAARQLRFGGDRGRRPWKSRKTVNLSFLTGYQPLSWPKNSSSRLEVRGRLFATSRRINAAWARPTAEPLSARGKRDALTSIRRSCNCWRGLCATRKATPPNTIGSSDADGSTRRWKHCHPSTGRSDSPVQRWPSATK